MIMKEIKGRFMGNIDMLEADVKNCPDKVWTMKSGGDYFWQQILHALMSLEMFLVIPESSEQIPAMTTSIDPSAISLREGEPKSTPTKDEILDIVKQSRDFVNKFFEKVDSSMLDKKVPFFNQEQSLSFMLLLGSGHIMYHQGICDALLRDNGAKASL